MELKSLIIGLFLSIAAFAVKSGGGLAVVLMQAPGKSRQVLSILLFMAGYGVVFAAAAMVLLNVNLPAHVALLQDYFKSGMTLHFLLALLLLFWGVRLLKNKTGQKQVTRGWIPLVLPCPVCFTVVLLSCSFLNAIYPNQPLIFFTLYAGFILISLVVAFIFSALVQNQASVGTFLGTLMLYIAIYFMLSVIVIPQFADLDKIFRISYPETAFELSPGGMYVIILSVGAFIFGFIDPLKRE